MAQPTIATMLRNPPELHEKLEKLKAESGVPINTLIVKLIEKGIDELTVDLLGGK